MLNFTALVIIYKINCNPVYVYTELNPTEFNKLIYPHVSKSINKSMWDFSVKIQIIASFCQVD